MNLFIGVCILWNFAVQLDAVALKNVIMRTTVLINTSELLSVNDTFLEIWLSDHTCMKRDGRSVLNREFDNHRRKVDLRHSGIMPQSRSKRQVALGIMAGFGIYELLRNIESVFHPTTGTVYRDSFKWTHDVENALRIIKRDLSDNAVAMRLLSLGLWKVEVKTLLSAYDDSLRGIVSSRFLDIMSFTSSVLTYSEYYTKHLSSRKFTHNEIVDAYKNTYVSKVTMLCESKEFVVSYVSALRMNDTKETIVRLRCEEALCCIEIQNEISDLIDVSSSQRKFSCFSEVGPSGFVYINRIDSYCSWGLAFSILEGTTKRDFTGEGLACVTLKSGDKLFLGKNELAVGSSITEISKVSFPLVLNDTFEPFDMPNSYSDDVSMFGFSTILAIMCLFATIYPYYYIQYKYKLIMGSIMEISMENA